MHWYSGDHFEALQMIRDRFPDKRIVFLMSVLADKDYHAMIRTVAPLGASLP